MRKKDGKVDNKTVRKKIQVESQKKTKERNPNFVLCKCAKNKKLLNYIQLAEKRFKKKDLVQCKMRFFLYDWLTAKDWYQTLTGHLHNSAILLLPPESISFFSLSFLNSIIPTRFK